MTYKEIPGYCNFYHFYRNILNRLQDGAQIVEVGVFYGHSVAYMATLAKEAGKKIKIYAVDTFEGSIEHKGFIKRNYRHKFIANIEACGVSEFVECIQSDSVIAASKYNDEQFDFIFIDADHSYDAVKADIKAWFPKVKKNGIFAGHDYRSSPDVKKAVDEFLLKHLLQFKYDLHENVWIIQK